MSRLTSAVSSFNASELGPSLLFVAILVLIVARRTYLTLSGSRYSPQRLYGFFGFAFLLFALFAGTTLYSALGTWGWFAWLLLAPYGAAIGAAALAFEPRVRRTAQFETRPDGQTYYRLPWLVPVLYLVLFTSRLAIEVALFGLSSLTSPTFPTSLPASVLSVVVLFDLLYGVSVGLLLGRAVGTTRAYRATEPTPAPEPRSLSSPPLP